MPGKIELVLPGLFDLPLYELDAGLLSDDLPALNRILRLANSRPGSAFSIDAILRQVLALEPADGQSAAGLPLAQAYVPPLERRSNRQLLFQAVHLRPDMHSAMIVPIQQNHDNLLDTFIIIKDLLDLFKVDCDIDAIADGLYLMRLKAFDAPLHYPHILSVLGKATNPYIEKSRQHLDWYKLLNEMQMFLHQHEINSQRLSRGLLPINSLWFWGGGSVPEDVDKNLAWCCDDAPLNEFADSLGLTCATLDNLGSLDNSVAAAVIDLRLLELLKTGVTAELDQLLLDIEVRLLQPLLRLVEAERKSLYLRAGFEVDLEFKAGAALKFWRRPKTLSSWSVQALDT